MSNTNLASRYAKQVDERFHRESQALLALNNDFKFTGVKTVNVYSIPTVAMTDYVRSGTSRYGDATDLARSVQSLTVRCDRSYNFIIDRGDKLQTEMVMDAGRALSRQIREVVVPEYDTYVFATLAAKAVEKGNCSHEAITKENAYEQFLAAMEHLGNRDVPDKGRVCFCSYRFANLIKQDPAFMKDSSASQEMILKGVMGEVDGCRIVKVPSGRLPAGAAFILTHPMAAIAPKQLEEYKIHDNPPGISGWLVEGRFIYDCFVLEEKADAVFYHGGQSVMKTLHVTTAAAAEGQTKVLVVPGAPEKGGKWVYETAATAADLTAAACGGSFTGADLAASGAVITPTSGHGVIQVVEVNGEGKVSGCGRAKLNVG